MYSLDYRQWGTNRLAKKGFNDFKRAIKNISLYDRVIISRLMWISIYLDSTETAVDIKPFLCDEFDRSPL